MGSRKNLLTKFCIFDSFFNILEICPFLFGLHLIQLKSIFCQKCCGALWEVLQPFDAVETIGPFYISCGVMGEIHIFRSGGESALCSVVTKTKEKRK